MTKAETQFVRVKTTIIFVVSAGLLLGGVAPSAASDIHPQQSVGMRALPSSAILRGEPYSVLMRRMPTLRQLSLAELRNNPRTVIGSKQINFTPMLQNPKALANIATRLSVLREHVRLIESETLISEVTAGIIVRDQLSYQVLAGKCKDPSIRSQIVAAGGSCFTQGSRESRVAAFGNPSDPRYVPDAQRRGVAIADYQRRLDQQSAQMARHITSLRKGLSNPQQRNALVARLGAAELARIERLSDDELKEELINSAQHRVEQVLFIPKADSPPRGPSFDRMRILPARPTNLSVLPKSNPPHLPSGRFESLADRVTMTKENGPIYYLTGFTYGQKYEWRKRVEITIDYFVDSETYYVEAYAGFEYGFGLRFPMQANLTAHYVRHGNNSTEAKVDLQFSPIAGTVDQFRRTGLPDEQLFDAKELVAQFDAYAGINLRVPVLGTLGPSIPPIGHDFTQDLPAPFTGGHFLPPAPGKDLVTQYSVDSLDLLGGIANYGVLGAKVVPAVQIDLHSDSLGFTLIDKIANRPLAVSATGQTVPIAVGSQLQQKYSEFEFGYPVYNLGFKLTPGLDARLFIDLELWSDHWDWYVWFPQLSVQFPPGGMNFTCHDRTNCTYPLKILWEAPQNQEVATPMPPLAPTDVTAFVQTADKVSVSWKPGDFRAAWFDVERRDVLNHVSGPRAPIGPIWKVLLPRQPAANARMTFTDNLVSDPNHTIWHPYTYRVCAGNTVGRTCSDAVEAKASQAAPRVLLPPLPPASTAPKAILR